MGKKRRYVPIMTVLILFLALIFYPHTVFGEPNIDVEGTVGLNIEITEQTDADDTTSLDYDTTDDHDTWKVEVDVEDTTFDEAPGIDLSVEADDPDEGSAEGEIYLTTGDTPSDLITGIDSNITVSGLKLTYEAEITEIENVEAGIYGGEVVFILSEQ